MIIRVVFIACSITMTCVSFQFLHRFYNPRLLLAKSINKIFRENLYKLSIIICSFLEGVSFSRYFFIKTIDKHWRDKFFVQILARLLWNIMLYMIILSLSFYCWAWLLWSYYFGRIFVHSSSRGLHGESTRNCVREPSCYRRAANHIHGYKSRDCRRSM